MHARCFLFALFALYGPVRLAQAEVFEQLDYVNYTARATSASLRSTLAAASPIRDHDKPFLGHTEWRVKWNFWWNRAGNGSCKITRVEVRLSGVIKLPFLSNANADQQQRFDKFLAALREHELGHFGNGKNAAMEIEREILALPIMSNCPELDSSANALGHSIVRKYNQRDLDYDATTNHGKTQGAWID